MLRRKLRPNRRCDNSGVLYLLLTAASRRFSGNSAVDRPLASISPRLEQANSNPKLHWNPRLASVPSDPASACGRLPQYQCPTGTRRGNRLVATSALAGNRDVFAASRMAAIFARLRDGAGDFVRIDPSIGCGLREIPRLTVGLGGMSAAFFAPGKALVDAIAVGLVGNDENPAVGPRCRPDNKRHAGEKR